MFRLPSDSYIRYISIYVVVYINTKLEKKIKKNTGHNLILLNFAQRKITKVNKNKIVYGVGINICIYIEFISWIYICRIPILFRYYLF